MRKSPVKQLPNGFLIGAALLLTPALALAQNAPASGPDNAALAQEVAKLRAEVAQLRAATGDNWMNERRKEEVKSVVKEVLADATTRPSTTRDNITAGYNGKNFYLASPDGSFLMNINGLVQMRYVYDHRHHAAPLTPGTSPVHTDDNSSGFTMRRVKLTLGGIFAKDFDYKIQMVANRDTNGVDMEEAWVGYNATESVRIFAGRYKDPILRDQFVGDRYQLAVERSTVAYVFAGNHDYTEGAGINWKPFEEARFTATINDGIASGVSAGTSTGFLNGGNDYYNDAVDYAFTVRSDFKLMGQWKQFEDFSSWSDTPTGLTIGSSFHYEKATTGDHQATGTTSVTGPYDDFIIATLDGNFKTNGFTLYMGGAFQQINTINTTTTGNFTNWGAVVQAGYFVIPDKLEPYVCYEYIGIDPAVKTRTNSVQIVTLGTNYYFRRHALKLSTDVTWALDPITNGNTLGIAGSSGTGLTGNGLLLDGAHQGDQIMARTQLQFLF